MNQSANTRSGPLEHDINASREPRTDLLDLVSTPAAADWKPRADLELMISMAAMVIFWTADLRVTASTRIGPSSLVVANPAPSCWRTGTAGQGAYAIDQRNGNDCLRTP